VKIARQTQETSCPLAAAGFPFVFNDSFNFAIESLDLDNVETIFGNPAIGEIASTDIDEASACSVTTASTFSTSDGGAASRAPTRRSVSFASPATARGAL
jgi:hypothetical protein